MKANQILEPFGLSDRRLAPGLHHLEVYTMRGLLGLHWYGDRDAPGIVVACPGAMGGFLGPGRAMYAELGVHLADRGIGTLVVDYRQPNKLESCVLDAMAAIDLAAQCGASAAVAVGHSFGGAVAVNVGAGLPNAVAGVCLLSTQSAGCEPASGLPPRPLLMIHGTDDEILAPVNSEMVRRLAGGHGEVELIPGEGHALAHTSDAIVGRLVEWVTPLLPAT